MSSDESHMLHLWLEAYEPAVEVELSGHEIRMRSTRHDRNSVVACTRGANDLASDLDATLARLVSQMS